jgi:hypothetical protein
MQNFQSYELLLKERTFKSDILASFYYKKTIPPKKRTKPVIVNDIRMKQNVLTGEVKLYERADYEKSISASLRRTRILINSLLEMNDFEWFCTLTFDNKIVDRKNEEAVYHCYKKYIDNLKHQFPNAKYITIPERHKDGCIHFHILMAGLTNNELGLADSNKVNCHWAVRSNGICSKSYFDKTKDKYELNETDGLTIYNITNFQYGLTTATKIISRERCNSYIKKYLDKALGCTGIFKKRFFYSKNLQKPIENTRTIIPYIAHPLSLNLFQPPAIKNYLRKAKQHRFSEHNVLQIRVDNGNK